MNNEIKVTVAGRVATLSIGDANEATRYFHLSEQDCRRMRAEMNRAIQRFVEKRGRS